MVIFTLGCLYLTIYVQPTQLQSNSVCCRNYINPLHPKITMYILHTVLKIFPEVLIKRNCFAINSSFS